MQYLLKASFVGELVQARFGSRNGFLDRNWDTRQSFFSRPSQFWQAVNNFLGYPPPKKNRDSNSNTCIHYV